MPLETTIFSTFKKIVSLFVFVFIICDGVLLEAYICSLQYIHVSTYLGKWIINKHMREITLVGDISPLNSFVGTKENDFPEGEQ